MSEQADQAVNAAEQAHRYSGAVGIGPATDMHQIDRGREICVTYCLTPGQRRRGTRCPSCYGPIAIRAITGDEIEPAGTRLAWLIGSLLGGWAHAWREATIGMVRETHAIDRRNGDRHGHNGHDRASEVTT